MALRLGDKTMARQRERSAQASAGTTAVFDDATGLADVPRHISPERESRRRFI